MNTGGTQGTSSSDLAFIRFSPSILLEEQHCTGGPRCLGLGKFLLPCMSPLRSLPSPQKDLIPSISTECLRAATLLGWRGESRKPGQEPGWQHWKNNICLHISGSVLGMRGQGDFPSCNSKVANSSVASGRDTSSQSGHREQPPIMLLRTMDDDSRDSLKPKLSVKPRAGEEQWRFATF